MPLTKEVKDLYSEHYKTLMKEIEQVKKKNKQKKTTQLLAAN